MNKMAKIFAVFVVLLLTFVVSGCAPSYTQEELDNAVLQAEQAKNVELEQKVKELNNELATEKEAINAEMTAIEKELETKIVELENAVNSKEELQISYDELKSVNDELETKVVTFEEEQAVMTQGFNSNGMFLGETKSFSLSDRQVSKLLDDEIVFDKENYNAEELLTLNNVNVAINENDFEHNAYLSFLTNDIKYTYEIETGLDTSLIDDDNTLKINLLGKEVEINKWAGNEVTFIYGEDYFVEEGDVIEYQGQTIEIVFIGEDNVFVVSGQDREKIDESETKLINGIEIFVEYTINRDEGTNFATIRLGEEVETKIKSGDEYAEDSIWDWVITANSIGLELNTDIDSIDSDEDYKALAYTETLCLPNDYVCIEFNELSDEDMNEYRLQEKDGFVKISGDLVYGTTDYDELYADMTGFYEDKDGTVQVADNTQTIKLGDSDADITIVNDTLNIDDIVLKMDMTTLTVATINISDKEDNYRNEYGIVIETPEDSLEDEDLTIIVPEEQLEASFVVY